MAERRIRHRDVASLAAALALGLAVAAPAPAQEVLPDPEAETGEMPTGPVEGEEDAAAEQEDLSVSPVERARDRLETLYEALADPGNAEWERTESEIWRVWSRSGSPAMDLLLRRAEEAAGEGDTDLAMQFLDDLVRLAPEFAEGWNKRATLHFMREELGASVADIERTLALEPRHFGALSGLGVILERVGDKAGALRAYRRALEIHPNMKNAADQIEQLAVEVEGREL